LAFNKRDATGNHLANIVVDPGGEVWGVAYFCNPEALAEMDRYEGAASGHYYRRPVRVVTRSGEPLDALTYIAGEEHVGDEGSPPKEYLQLILSGAEHHGLPQAYIQRIKTLASKRQR
jgi:gamma-glutamylcyclotransferase (GGCT)/AIG2-like uncharacterized protein YtfP